MPKFLMTEQVDARDKVITARLGAGSGAANNWTDKEVGKFVKQVGESRYDLCAAGDEIQGVVSSIESATMDAYTMGGVRKDGNKQVTFDGLQATPGTGNLAIGDFVVCGTPVAKDTALSAPAKVCKATAAAKDIVFLWRVVSLGSAGTGAPGTTGIVERV